MNLNLINEQFKAKFGTSGQMFTSPRRVNLIGEHTDYNGGDVFPGAVDKGMIAEGGMLILEHGKDHSFAEHPCFVQERVYGSVHFSFFEPRKEEE